MPRFIISGSASLESGANRIEIGARATCTLQLDDPMVAQHHAEIAFDGKFWLRDFNTATGTYLNGIAIADDVEILEGDVVSLGFSTLEVTQIDGETLRLNAQPLSSPYYDRKVDPDDWVRQEVTFGRFRTLRGAIWVALVIVVIGGFLLPVSAFRQPLLLPGKLSTAHAGLLATDASCNNCHNPTHRVEMTRCTQCHANIASGHGSVGYRSAGSPVAVFSEQPDNFCITCHQEHEGTGTLIPEPEAWSQACTSCHADGGAAAPAVVEKHEEFVELSFTQFSHQSHSAMECSSCHKGTDPDPQTGRDYGVVQYEQCLDCHQRSDDNTPPAHVDVASMPPLEHRWPQLAWHGTGPHESGEGCESCHTRSGSSQLRQVAMPVRSGYSMPRRHHPEITGRDCKSCHRKDSEQLTTATGSQVFHHKLHVRHPNDPEECLGCHAGVRQASGLASLAAGPSLHNCSETCHATAAAAATPVETQDSVMHTEFPHDRHVAHLPCNECHTIAPEFDDSSHGGNTAGVNTRSCVDCHQKHDNIAGGDCSSCHSTPGFQTTRVQRTRFSSRSGKSFSHTNAQHAGVVAERGCAACHSGIETSTRLEQIPAPAQDTCGECHNLGSGTTGSGTVGSGTTSTSTQRSAPSTFHWGQKP